MARKLVVEIVGDASSLERSFGRAQRSAKGFDRGITQSFRGALAGSGAFSALGRQVAFASAAFLGTAGFVAAGKLAIDTASNLAEQQNKVNVVFGTSGRAVTEWAKTTAVSLGIANDQALEAAGTFGNLFRTVNLGASQNARLSQALVKLSADLASFNNADPSEVLLALQSGLIGEAEPLRRFGVLLSEARVQQEALRATGKRTAAQLSNQDKVLARYALILKDTKVAQGDFSRTQDGLANATRQLQAEIRDTTAAIGTALLPTVSALTIRLRDWLADSENQAKIMTTVNKTLKITGQVLHGVSVAFKVYRTAMKPVLDQMHALVEVGHTAIGVFKGLKGAIGGVAGHLGLGGGPKKLGPGQSPIGENALGGPAPVEAVARAVHVDVKRHASLRFQLSLLQEELAKAELTAGKRDDRAVLTRTAVLLRELIAKTTDLKKRTTLYQQLGSVEGQIREIDKTAADKRVEHQQKLLDAAKTQLQNLRDVEDKLKQRIKDIQGRFADAVDTARSGIGELFAGPVLQPSDDARRRTLGLGKALSSDAGKLTADLRAQVKQFAAFQKDLNLLAKRGAPAELIRELRAQGLGAAPQAHALATARKGTLSEFLKQFGKREKLAVTTAKTVMKSQLVTLHATRLQLAAVREKERPIIVMLDGKEIARSTTKHQNRGAKTTVAQRTGRYAGTSFLVSS